MGINFFKKLFYKGCDTIGISRPQDAHLDCPVFRSYGCVYVGGVCCDMDKCHKLNDLLNMLIKIDQINNN